MNTFGQRLKELRLEKELTQKELADALKTNNSSVCDWECGRTEPSIEMILNICRLFEVSADYLLGLED
ncbi:MAG: helix-turn-helix transcriptional regulator [Clostridia bacterium]|nr:helix-turn-helix transcriptional regulator [Clostridia bacterium]